MAKGNIVDIWTRVPITKYQMIIGEFPHPDWPYDTFIPTKEHVDLILVNNSYRKNTSYHDVVECKYHEMEDKLDHMCEGFFLIVNGNELFYNLYFEKESDAAAFKMIWC